MLSRIRPSVERLTRRPPSPHELFTPQRALGDGANDDRKGSTPELYRFSPAPVETSSNPAQVSRTMNPCRSLYMYYYFLFLLSFYVLFFFHIFLSIWLFLPFFSSLSLFHFVQSREIGQNSERPHDVRLWRLGVVHFPFFPYFCAKRHRRH